MAPSEARLSAQLPACGRSSHFSAQQHSCCRHASPRWSSGRSASPGDACVQPRQMWTSCLRQGLRHPGDASAACGGAAAASNGGAESIQGFLGSHQRSLLSLLVSAWRPGGVSPHLGWCHVTERPRSPNASISSVPPPSAPAAASCRTLRAELRTRPPHDWASGAVGEVSEQLLLFHAHPPPPGRRLCSGLQKRV